MQENGDLLEHEKALLKRHPLPYPIFLPTQKFSLADRISGLEKVVEIYEHTYESLYRPRLKSLKAAFKHRKRAFVIGNGPSLNQTDLSLLKDEVTFGVNGIFLKFKDTDFRPTFYVVEDHLVAEDRRDFINRLEGPIKLFPIYLGYCLDDREDTVFYNHIPRRNYPHGFDFSLDASDHTYAGCTVTFSCLQLAYYMGFQEIYLIGVDCDYAIPKDVEEKQEYSVKILDMKTSDPNHFDPDYFGKGYRWHDPQVDKMRGAYQEAKKVCDAHGVTIYNATIGGKLEVFPRVDYHSLFPDKTLQPKVLLIDITRLGDQSATGQMKQSLFGACPPDDLLQVHLAAKGAFGLYSPSTVHPIAESYTEVSVLEQKCREFKPDVIYYRPVSEHPYFHDLACSLINQIDAPTVIHIVDDWPERLKHQDPITYEKFDASFRELLRRASARMSICDAMSVAFKQRYGVDFLAFANCIHPEEWEPLDEPKTASPETPDPKPFTIRYLGSLATDMTRESVLDVAKIVQELQVEFPIKLEIYTTQYWKHQILELFSGYAGVTIHDAQFGESYRQLMMSSDALLIAYNFDEASIRYVRYSIANKLPECLASGKPTIVYGPTDVATVAYAAQIGCAQLILERDLKALKDSILQLATNSDYQNELGQKAREYVFAHHDAAKIQANFYRVLRDAAVIREESQPRFIANQLLTSWRQRALAPNPSLDLTAYGCKSFERVEHAHIDETRLIAEYLQSKRSPAIMVDVGAHFGSALSHFANRNWQVYAFEPDPDNRQQLLRKFSGHSNVSISSSAVSDRSGQTVSLYSSDESTGISTLAPFRDSHEAKCQVTTTTVKEICEQQRINHIDFLKIDTEGFDLMVLQGVPWERIKPDIIECEFEDRKTVPLGYTFDDLAQYLLDRGYFVLVSEWHPVISYGIKHDWYRLTTYPCKLASPDAWGNLLAFKEPPDLTKVAAIAQKLIKIHPSSSQTPDSSMTTSSSQSPTPLTTTNGAGSNHVQLAVVQSVASAPNGQVKAPPRSKVSHPTPVQDSLLVSTSIPETVNNRSAYLLKRIARYYRRWPLGVAALAVVFNCLGMVDDVPFRWAFTGGGTALTLFLVGHAATRSDFVIESAQSTADQAKEIAVGSRNKAKLSIRQGKRAFQRIKQVRREVTQTANRVQRAEEKITAVKATAMSAKRSMSFVTERVEGVEQLAQRASETSQQAIQAGQEATAMANQVAETTNHLLEATQKTTEAANRVTDLFYKSNISNAALFQPFSRHLSDKDISEFLKSWLPTLGLQLDRRALGYLAHQICLIEDACAGRLATTVEDMLLRILVARSIQSRELSVLEIGSLFGINLGILYESCLGYFETIHLTALDPLDGYYAQSLFDKITQVPVNRETFDRNMRRLDISGENITLIQALSTDDEALTVAGQNQYNLLVIDGDHSYAGVKFDFDHYLAAVDVGGYIIFDDYATDHWPEVAQFVDKEVKSNPCVEFVGASWRTAVFRVIRRNLK